MINHVRIIATVIVLSLAITAIAATKGNEGKGRFFFKQTCKNCHTKGAVGGEVTPLSKTIPTGEGMRSTTTSCLEHRTSLLLAGTLASSRFTIPPD